MRNKKNFSIKNKIIFMNIIILIPILIVIYAITIDTLHKNLISKSVEYLKNESYNSQIYVINYLKREQNLDAEEVLKNTAPFMAAYISNNLKCRTQIYSHNLSLLGDSQNGIDINYKDDIFNGTLGNKCYRIYKNSNEEYILFSSPIYINDKSIGCIRYIYSLENEMTILKRTLCVMFFTGILGILLDFILSNILSKGITEPITTLKKASENVKEGIFNKEVNIQSNDEIEELSTTFNQMSKSIENYINSLKNEKEKQNVFFNNATHQLKTPLTSIIGYSDLIERLNQNKDVTECAKYINKEGKRLLKLIEEILDISKYKKEDIELKKEPCNMDELVKDCINMLKLRFDMYNIKIHLNIESKILYIDKEKTSEVILNILDNALKHSECNNIYVSTLKDSNYKLSIKDDGQGICKEDLSNLFQPFFRGSSPKGSGHGLGLNICKLIMTKQQGDIFIKSNESTGTEIILCF